MNNKEEEIQTVCEPPPGQCNVKIFMKVEDPELYALRKQMKKKMQENEDIFKLLKDSNNEKKDSGTLKINNTGLSLK